MLSSRTEAQDALPVGKIAAASDQWTTAFPLTDRRTRAKMGGLPCGPAQEPRAALRGA